jgi:putative transposase
MPRRLLHWDYAAPGAYFITVCTHRRRPWFGVIVGERVRLSPIGRLACDCLVRTFAEDQDTRLEVSVVMPDHVHLLVQKTGPAPSIAPVDQLVREFKARLTHAGRAMELVRPEEHVWQRGFFDRIIRTQDEHAALVAYVETNPLRWTLKRMKSASS